ncbi:Acetylxylan esterase precursor [Gemmata obscuriglobus]|uniref:Alpha/beta hydrolase n=1 Tax=Gemmata obscuriglobus TaxID=114 RepID=A0A2Z3H2A5_9BACT|nr:alpha/beta hydrolase [Gemmata obscuriglobus]AWM40909.1 alpha/beta hydrolase [Gemmata obscuriglobus]QEG25790.1 Acetylxylan esterase precursor [Gemmata obscuriglobus]VTR99649.1 xylanase : Xylanase OS=Chthoniobacter flavus Ellin428 GN=CfE428DRAFT_5438 PE=4 SV=1: Abhydrolase_3 [Gemmata obscuriglobus UQM 2246]
MIRGLALALALPAALALSAARAAEPVTHKLWPGKAPGETKDIGAEKLTEPKKGQADVKRLGNVSEPTITVYAPPKEKANGAAVVVAPGGGYSILAIEHEGTDVCKWLNDLGVTAVLLKYRVPKREAQSPDNLAMVQDAQRAVTLVRGMSKELGVDPNRVGMLGFSAGGHLTVCTALTQKRLYEKVDQADEAVGHRPNFCVLVYPAYLTDKGGALKPEFAVTKDSPPMFFAHSSDDPVTSEGSVALYLALTKNKVPAELHLYATGGHGYGMRKTPHPCASWPDRAGDWLKSRGLLDKAK